MTKSEILNWGWQVVELAAGADTARAISADTPAHFSRRFSEGAGRLEDRPAWLALERAIRAKLERVGEYLFVLSCSGRTPVTPETLDMALALVADRYGATPLCDPPPS